MKRQSPAPSAPPQTETSLISNDIDDSTATVVADEVYAPEVVTTNVADEQHVISADVKETVQFCGELKKQV